MFENNEFFAKRKNYWIIGVVIIGIWLILGGLQVWKKYAPEPPEEDYLPAVNETPIDVNQDNSGRLDIADDRTEEILPPAGFLGYITGIENKLGTYYLTIDYVQWLTGDQAVKAALEDGDCIVADACAPNGFYIRNTSKKKREFQISPFVEIRMQSYSYTASGSLNVNEQISLEEFVDNVWSANAPKAYLSAVPYHVEREDDVIVSITEKYVP